MNEGGTERKPRRERLKSLDTVRGYVEGDTLNTLSFNLGNYFFYSENTLL